MRTYRDAPQTTKMMLVGFAPADVAALRARAGDRIELCHRPNIDALEREGTAGCDVLAVPADTEDREVLLRLMRARDAATAAGRGTVVAVGARIPRGFGALLEAAGADAWAETALGEDRFWAAVGSGLAKRATHPGLSMEVH